MASACLHWASVTAAWAGAAPKALERISAPAARAAAPARGGTLFILPAPGYGRWARAALPSAKPRPRETQRHVARAGVRSSCRFQGRGHAPERLGELSSATSGSAGFGTDTYGCLPLG